MEGQSLAEWPEFPFCGARCKMIDLGRWLGETYRLRKSADLPAEEADEPPPEEPEAP